MRAFISLLLYRVIFFFLLPILLLVLIIRSKNNPAYRKRLFERLGMINGEFKQHGILVHAASVGEVIALKAYINGLLHQFPDIPITLTTFTPTGSAQVKKLFGDRVQHCYLPLDVLPCTWLFLSRLKPRIVVLMETEIWPNLIAQCADKQILLQLINGRLSDKSMNRYRKLSWLITASLQKFNQIWTQSDENLANFLALGANKETTKVSGNLKFDIKVTPEVNDKIQSMATSLNSTHPIWLVASTHEGDETLALKSFSALKKQHPSLLMMLVPRHPERFEQVYTLCRDSGFNVAKRSSKDLVCDNTDIWLIDTLGELLACCDIADIVTMGGSFSNIGGHNPLEPALFKKPIIVGPNMQNFTFINQQMLSNKAIIQLAAGSKEQHISQLTDSVDWLLSNKDKQQALGKAAYQVVKMNQGASQLSVDALAKLLQ